MALTNLFLRSLGLSWFIDHNHGLLGLYTNTAHLMLLGSALALHRFTAHHRRRDLWLVGLYLVAMALDGRRALVITAVLQLMVAAPRLMSALRPGQRLALVVGTAVVGSALVLGNLEWIEQRFSFTEEDISTAHRQAQIPPLLEKIAENPVFGGGFGTVASLLRSELRPFSYEVDFLATVMKLGVVGSMLYFGTYLAVLFHAYRRTGSRGIFYASAGLPFFFYMTTNGNQAMSTDSAVFHIFLFLLIAFSIVPRTPRIGPGARAAQGAAA
jgi:O-antigen ligase